MIILTNCLTGCDDEGSLKVAERLISGLKKRYPEIQLVTYENESPLADRHLRLNKFMLSCKLARLLRKQKEPLFFVPLYARMLPTALRVFVLSLYARHRIRVLLPMRPRENRLGNVLMRLSGAELIVLSDQSYRELDRIFPGKIHCIRAAVDTQRFIPVSVDKKTELREKFRLPVDKPLVLHVGHMKYGRNVDKLLNLDEKYHGVLAVSTTTAAFRDMDLEAALRKKSNITVIDRYIPDIQELYQAADLYFFPVVAPRNCIDVPLSAFEAAACNLPVLATPYGELREMLDKKGFHPIESFEPAAMNAAIERAMACKTDIRENVLAYDWEKAVGSLLEILQTGDKSKGRE